MHRSPGPVGSLLYEAVGQRIAAATGQKSFLSTVCRKVAIQYNSGLTKGSERVQPEAASEAGAWRQEYESVWFGLYKARDVGATVPKGVWASVEELMGTENVRLNPGDRCLVGAVRISRLVDGDYESGQWQLLLFVAKPPADAEKKPARARKAMSWPWSFR